MKTYTKILLLSFLIITTPFPYTEAREENNDEKEKDYNREFLKLLSQKTKSKGEENMKIMKMGAYEPLIDFRIYRIPHGAFVPLPIHLKKKFLTTKEGEEETTNREIEIETTTNRNREEYENNDKEEEYNKAYRRYINLLLPKPKEDSEMSVIEMFYYDRLRFYRSRERPLIPVPFRKDKSLTTKEGEEETTTKEIEIIFTNTGETTKEGEEETTNREKETTKEREKETTKEREEYENNDKEEEYNRDLREFEEQLWKQKRKGEPIKYTKKCVEYKLSHLIPGNHLDQVRCPLSIALKEDKSLTTKEGEEETTTKEIEIIVTNTGETTKEGEEYEYEEAEEYRAYMAEEAEEEYRAYMAKENIKRGWYSYQPIAPFRVKRNEGASVPLPIHLKKKSLTTKEGEEETTNSEKEIETTKEGEEETTTKEIEIIFTNTGETTPNNNYTN